MAFDIEKVREDFPILARRMNGKQIAYLDNAATTQKPKQVVDAISGFYTSSNANAHRGGHELAEEATEIYEEAREKIASFIGAAPEEIVFTKNATEALNFAARFCVSQLGAKSALLTEMEHHSNIVNWQLAGAKIDYVKMRSYGKLCNEDVEEKLEKRPGAFSFVHASNVLGTVNDAGKLCRLAKKAGAYSVVDATQSVPHFKADVHAMGCDFLAFSAHKALGPDGIGVLYIRKGLAEKLTPIFGGGGAIEKVSFASTTFSHSPWKFEPGTQDIPSAVGMVAGLEYIRKIGYGTIERRCSELHSALADELRSIPGAEIYGNGKKLGIASFNISKIHAHDIAQFASDDAVMIRAGHHCAQPLMKKLGVEATCRASFYLYNTEEEVDMLVAAVKKARKRLG